MARASEDVQNSAKIIAIGDSNLVSCKKGRFERYFNEAGIEIFAESSLKFANVDRCIQLFNQAYETCPNANTVLLLLGVNDVDDLLHQRANFDHVLDAIFKLIRTIPVNAKNGDVMEIYVQYPYFADVYPKIKSEVHFKLVHQLASNMTQSVIVMSPYFSYEERGRFLAKDNYHLNDFGKISMLMSIAQSLHVHHIQLLTKYNTDIVRSDGMVVCIHAFGAWQKVFSDGMVASRDPCFSVGNLSKGLLMLFAEMQYTTLGRFPISVEEAESLMPSGNQLVIFGLLKRFFPLARSVISKSGLRTEEQWSGLFDCTIANAKRIEDNQKCDLCAFSLSPYQNGFQHSSAFSHMQSLGVAFDVHILEESVDKKRLDQCLSHNARYRSSGIIAGSIDVQNSFFECVDYTRQNPCPSELNFTCLLAKASVFIPCSEKYTDRFLANPQHLAGVEFLHIGAMPALRLFINGSEISESSFTMYLNVLIRNENWGNEARWRGVPSESIGDLQVRCNYSNDDIDWPSSAVTQLRINRICELPLNLRVRKRGSFWQVFEFCFHLKLSKRSRRKESRIYIRNIYVPVCIVFTDMKMLADLTIEYVPRGNRQKDAKDALEYAGLNCQSFRAKHSEVADSDDECIEVSGDGEETAQSLARYRAESADDEPGHRGYRAFSSYITGSPVKLSNHMQQFNVRLLGEWEIARRRGLVELDTNRVKIEILDEKIPYRSSDVEGLLLDETLTGDFLYPIIRLDTAVGWIHAQGAIALYLSCELIHMCYDVQNATKETLTLRRRQMNSGLSIWQGNQIRQSLMLRCYDGDNINEYFLADITLDNMSFDGNSLKISFEQIGELGSQVRRRDFQAKIFACGNFAAVERTVTSLHSAIQAKEFEERDGGRTMDRLRNEIRQLELERRRVPDSKRKHLSRLEDNDRTLRHFGDRLDQLLTNLLVRGPAQYRGESPDADANTHCGAVVASKCTCQRDRSIDAMADEIYRRVVEDQTSELVIQGVAGGGKSTVIAKTVGKIVVRPGPEKIVVLAVTNSAVDNMVEKLVAQAHIEEGSATLTVFVSRTQFEEKRTKWRNTRNVKCCVVPSQNDERMGPASDTLRNILSKSKIVVCTCDLATNILCRVTRRNFNISYMFIDEASQLPILAFLDLAMKSSSIVLIGDHHQGEVYSTMERDYAKACYVYTSALAFTINCFRAQGAAAFAKHVIAMFISYRCNAETCALMSHVWRFDHCMVAATRETADQRMNFVMRHSDFLNSAFQNSSICVLHCQGTQIQVDNYSSVNIDEEHMVLDILDELKMVAPKYKTRDDFGKFSVGVLCMHSKAIEHLRDVLRHRYGQIPSWIQLYVVPSAQGRTFTFSIFMTIESSYDDVVCCPTAKRGLLSDRRHMTVALTRHEEGLFIITNVKRFLSQRTLMSTMLQNLHGDSLFYNPLYPASASKSALMAWELFMGLQQRGFVGDRLRDLLDERQDI